MSAVPPPSKKIKTGIDSPEENKEKSAFSDFPIQKSDPHLEKVHHVLCNELGQTEVLEKLNPSRSNGIHLGFSCWLNFDILAERKTPFAILCDFDPNMVALLDLMEQAIQRSKTPEEFMKNFWSNLSSQTELKFQGFLGLDGSLIDYKIFYNQMNEKGWLSSQEKFQTIKEMYAQDRIIHRLLDITDEESFDKINKWAKNHSLAFDTLYTSNIPEWLYSSNINTDKMHKNTEKIIDPQTIVITAQKLNQLGKEGPKLSLTSGRHPKVRYQPRKKTRSRTKFL